jgi:hypothetical protein
MRSTTSSTGRFVVSITRSNGEKSSGLMP